MHKQQEIKKKKKYINKPIKANIQKQIISTYEPQKQTFKNIIS